MVPTLSSSALALLAGSLAYAGAYGVTSCSNGCSGHGSCIANGICACDTGYTSPDCSVRTCLFSCSGRGLCFDGTCYCEPGWTGEGCVMADCASHGLFDAVTGKCDCEPGWVGPQCALRDTLCSGHGVWAGLNETCMCESGRGGLACEVKLCPSSDARVPCSGKGLCVDGTCRCAHGYAGQACDHLACPEGCSNRGRCESGGRCACDPGWGGPSCNRRQCAGLESWTLTLCSGHGTCISNGTCACRAGWTGVDCAVRTCPKDCSGRGLCQAGTCFCAPGYDGAACELALCPRGGADSSHAVCSGRGTCLDGACTCHPGWSGDDCSVCSCSGHGTCAPIGSGLSIAGSSAHKRCKCDYGFHGQYCAERDCSYGCYASEASGRGTCIDGECYCKPGWVGLECERPACEGGCGESESPPRGECVHFVPPTTGQTIAKTVMNVARAANGLNDRRGNVEVKATTTQLARCVCRDGWFGQHCNQPMCPRPPKATWQWASGKNAAAAVPDRQCSGRGECVNGACHCLPGFGGDACEKQACASDCSQRGTCVHVGKGDASYSYCACDTSYTGPGCAVRACPNNCSGVGECGRDVLDYKCMCPPGRGGVDCSRPACGPGCVSPRGACSADGKCHCAAGWAGAECDRPVCPGACSSNGKCTMKGCVCDAGWFGPSCSYQRCPDDCHDSLGRGSCHQGKCYCTTGFSGPNCNATCGGGEAAGGALLPLGVEELCSGRGHCTRARKCACDPGYGGDHCETRSCLMGCSGHGLCHDGTCLCALGFGGEDCAATTAPNARDCSTGCVHLCAARCSSALSLGGAGATTRPKSFAAFFRATPPPGDISESGSDRGQCFAKCRGRCLTSCRSTSAQRQLWAEQRRKGTTPVAAARAAAASRALGLLVPTAAALPPYEALSPVELLGNTMPH
jgi:syndecan 4